jgi:CheY-like chemotaxis protein
VGDREKALASGCNGYLEKPINPDTFVTEVERFLPPNWKGEKYDQSPDSR